MNVYRALERGMTAGLIRDELVSGGREPLTAQWGRVNDEGYVVLDDGAVLTEEVPALVPLSPGQRVVLHRSGQGLWIAGALSHVTTLTPGVGIDEMTAPGQYVLEDPALALPELSFPEQSIGWLLVQGNGNRALQRFTSESSGRTYTRTFSNGSWSAWVSQDEVRGSLTLEAPWTQYGDILTWGGPYYSVQGTQGMVSGMVTGGTGGSNQPIAFLPPEGRPSRNRIVAGAVDGVFADFQITPTGSIFLRDVLPSAPAWVSLSLAYRR